MTESEFIRKVLERPTSDALEDDEGFFYDRTRHLILPPRETDDLTTTPEDGDSIGEKYARIAEEYRRRRNIRRDAAD
jgi:hypothetical protein